MNKIGLYLRVSTEEQARIQEGSLVSQRQRLQQYVDYQLKENPKYGLVIDTYCDEAKSAKDLNRPEFQRLLRDVKQKKINLILATDLSRLSRSMGDFCKVWEFLKSHQAKFITLREQFDTTTASGEMMVFNLMNFSQYERKQTSERLKANFEARATRGLWNGGVIPMGYKRNPDSKGLLTVDPDGKEKLQLIFKLFLKHKNLRQTCLDLNERGIRTRHYVSRSGITHGNTLFTVASLYKILTNPTPLGLREVHKRTGRGEKTTVQGRWEAILDAKVFDATQKILEQNRTRYKPQDWKTYAYPLTGIATCGECGLKLNGKSAHGKTKRHHYYDHPRTLKSYPNGDTHDCKVQRLRAEKVEDELLQAMKKILSDETYIQNAIKLYQASHKTDSVSSKSQIKKVEKELLETTNKIQTLIDRMTELPKSISLEPVIAKLTSLQSKEAELKTTAQKLQNQNKQSQDIVSENDLKQSIQRAVSNLESATKEQTKTIFENTLQYVKFDGGEKMRLGVYVSLSDNSKHQDEKKGAAGNSGSSFNFKNSFSNFNFNSHFSLGCSTTLSYGGEGEIRTLVAR